MTKPDKIPFDWIDLTEEMVFHPPRDMENFREYRIEYGGIHENCRVEGNIWLPMHADPDMIVALLRGLIAVENNTTYGDEMGRSEP